MYLLVVFQTKETVLKKRLLKHLVGIQSSALMLLNSVLFSSVRIEPWPTKFSPNNLTLIIKWNVNRTWRYLKLGVTIQSVVKIN